MASATVRLHVRTRRLWMLRLAARLAWTRLWPLVDALAGAVRVEYRTDGPPASAWRDMDVRVVREGREVRLEQVTKP